MNKDFLYIEKNTKAPLIIWAKHKPSAKNIPKTGTWLIKEWTNNSWSMPCCPEITLNIINDKLKYIGEIK